MKIKQAFKKLYSSHFKTSKIFLLAGLMGGLTACKDAKEPDMPDQKQIASRQHDEGPVFIEDKFWQNLSDVGDATFDVMGEAIMKPVLNGYGHVSQLLVYGLADCDSHEEHLNYSCYIGENETTQIANRIDGGFNDSLAIFDFGKTYEFIVRDCFSDPREDWAIHEVNESAYENVFKNMSDSALAQLAWERLTEVNADLGHRQNIYNAILNGEGRWKVRQEIIPVKSRGGNLGLKHSDFGLLQGTNNIQGEPEKCENFSYCGGVESKRLAAPGENARFNGKAYVVINDNYYYQVDDMGHWGNGSNAMRILSTDSGAAVFAHGTEADTLIMPINNWYTVKIITKNNGQQMECYFEDYQSLMPEANWGYKHQSNDNLASEIVETWAGSSFYVSEQNNADFEFNIAMSVPDYYGEKDMATGLNNVYCAPGRRSAPANNSIMPSEVVIQGVVEEKNTTAPGLQFGRGMNFAFGGINQKQR